MRTLPQKSLSRKITVIMTIATGFLALASIAIQAYVDYQKEMKRVEDNALHHVRSLYFPISEALWDLDMRQLDQLLISIGEDSNIQNLQIKGIEGTLLNPNITGLTDAETHSYELHYNDRFLGTLSYQIDDSLIQDEVLSRLALGLLLNAIEALVIIAIVLFVVYSLVTQPLIELFKISKTIDPKASSKLMLPNSLTERKDELSYVAAALQQLNNASRRAIAVQKRTERQLLHHQDQLEQSIEFHTEAYKTQSKLHRILADMSINILTCSEENMSTVMYRAFEPIGRLLKIDRLSVLTIDDYIAHYHYSWRTDEDSNLNQKGFTIESMTLLQRRLISLEPIIINDIEVLKTSATEEYNMMKKLGISSLAIFPLIDEKTIFGLLIASITSAAHDWVDTQTAILSRLSTTVSEMHIRMRNHKEMIAIQEELIEANKRLQIAAETDELTGLPNRRPFMNELKHHANNMNTSSITTMMIDIDHFKQYNDLYGHVQGDFALRYVANSLKQTLSPCGHIVARFGGEEFCVLLVNVSAQEAMFLAEKIRQGVISLNIPHSGNPPSGVISISIGVAHQMIEEQVTTQQLLENADVALYRAKQQGRNQVQSEPPSLE